MRRRQPDDNATERENIQLLLKLQQSEIENLKLKNLLLQGERAGGGGGSASGGGASGGVEDRQRNKEYRFELSWKLIPAVAVLCAVYLIFHTTSLANAALNQFVCDNFNIRCPRPTMSESEASQIEKLFDLGNENTILEFQVVPGALKTANKVIRERIGAIVEYGVDEKWQKLTDDARLIAKHYNDAERFSYRAVLKSRQFFENSIEFIDTVVLAAEKEFENDQIASLRQEITSMISSVEETNEIFKQAILQLDDAHFRTETLITEAMKEENLRRLKAEQTLDNAQWSKEKQLAVFAAIFTLAPIASTVVGASLWSAMFVGGVSSTGFEIFKRNGIEIAKEEAEMLEKQAQQFGMGKDVLQTVRDSIHQFSSQLEVLHTQLEDAQTAMYHMSGTLSAEQVGRFKSKAETAKKRFSRIVASFNAFVERYIRHPDGGPEVVPTLE